MNRIAVVVTIVACASTVALVRVEVSCPERNVHPALRELVAERHAAVAAGDLVLAKDTERRIQAKLEELHPLPQPEPVNIRLLPGGGEVPQSFDPDVLIDTCRILSTAADYELNGAMYAAAHRMGDTTTQVYKSRDHGETWERIFGFLSSPATLQEKTGLVVGEGESTFVYGFLIDPDNNGDLYCLRFDTAGHSGRVFPVLAGPDTVTDFAVCRDYSGDDYWVYVSACNELGDPLGHNDRILRSVNYGKTWGVVQTAATVNDPHLSASAGTWLYHTYLLGPNWPGMMRMDANSYYMTPDSFPWATTFLPDTFGAADPVAATSFEVPVDSATLWMMYSHKRTSGGNWDIGYLYTEDAARPVWSDSITLAGDPGVDERFPDIRSYTLRGNAWMNASYIFEDRPFRAVKRTYANSGDPSNWSTPVTVNETSAGTGSGVRPKLCYTPGGPGTGAGLVFTGAGLTGMYWNAPWHTGMAVERTRDQGQRAHQTICRGVLFLPEAGMANNRVPMTMSDISGRRVMELRPGENDIRRLAPGVYFLRSANSDKRPAVRKVVIQH